MPLIKGFSPRSFQSNVHEMRLAGHPTNQCVKVAYVYAREALKRARRRETQKLRDAWKVAIAAGLKGTSEKSRRAAAKAKRDAETKRKAAQHRRKTNAPAQPTRGTARSEVARKATHPSTRATLEARRRRAERAIAGLGSAGTSKAARRRQAERERIQWHMKNIPLNER